MANVLSNKYFQAVLRIIIGIIFIYASVNKLFNPQEFAKAILRYELLPVYFVSILAIVIPWLEFITGFLLVTGIYKKGASLVALISLVIFTAALISAYARGLEIGCGCFSLEETSSKGDILLRIIQDFLMIAGIIIIYKFSGSKEKQEKDESQGINTAEESV